MARDTAPRAALGGVVDKRAAGAGARWRGDPHRPCPGVLARAARFWPLLYNDWHPLCAATWLAYLLEKSRGLRSGTKIHLSADGGRVGDSSGPIQRACRSCISPTLATQTRSSFPTLEPNRAPRCGWRRPWSGSSVRTSVFRVRDLNVAAPDPPRRATLGCTRAGAAGPGASPSARRG